MPRFYRNATRNPLIVQVYSWGNPRGRLPFFRLGGHDTPSYRHFDDLITETCEQVENPDSDLADHDVSDGLLDGSGGLNFIATLLQ